MNITDILKLKFPDEYASRKILLTETKDGLEIIKFHLDSLPTKEDLDSWAKEVDLVYRQKLAVEARCYPSLGDQLDMQYKDLRDDTTTWYDCIAAIKAAHPKPTE